MNLVVGATGFLGGEICRRLRARSRKVRGLVRRTAKPETVAKLESLGVELVEGDLRDRHSLDRACHDVSAVVSTATATRPSQPGDSIEATDLQGQLDLVEASRTAAVEKFVYVSYSGQLGFADPLTVAKRTVEQRVRESGMTYTILRPSFFMEVWLSAALGFDFPSAKATIYGPGENRISWVSLGDVAEFAVQSLDNPAAADTTIEIGGPEALSPREVVEVFEQILGRAFEVDHVPREELEQALAAATNSLEKTFAALKLAYAKGNVVPMKETLDKFALELTSVREYAQRALSTAVHS